MNDINLAQVEKKDKDPNSEKPLNKILKKEDKKASLEERKSKPKG